MSNLDTKKMICIRCPMGCQMDVAVMSDGQITIAGNTCKLGQQYAKDEIFNPSRIVTSTVRVKNGDYPLVPVWTTGAVPKGKVTDIMSVLGRTEIDAPVEVNQTIIKNILGLGVDIEASGSINYKVEQSHNKLASMVNS